MTSKVTWWHHRKFIHISSNECCIDVWLIIFIVLGRPSKGEYSGLSNTEKCKLYRSKESKQKKNNDALRKKVWRTKLKENPIKYKRYKVNERYCKLQNKENKAVEWEEAGQCFSSPDNSFSNKPTLHRNLPIPSWQSLTKKSVQKSRSHRKIS